MVGRYADGWKIRVAAPPERGRANDAVVALLATTLGVVAGDIRVVSGHGSRDKMVEVAGLAATDLEARLASATRKDR